jgi:predicted RNA-binding protein YlxR (DUF448 family)/ribosomal protein L7Ae-like RNA K-turn-binding protein
MPAERRCLGCSRIRPREELIRMVRTPEGGVVFDITGRLPGRGAWLCPDRKCLTAAMKSRKLSWTYHKETKAPSVEEALADLAGLLRRRALSLVGIAARSGALVSGHDAVAEALERREAHLLLLAADLADRTRDDLAKRAGEAPRFVLGTMEELGKAMGHPDRGTAAITNPSLAGSITELYGIAAGYGLTI